jgi:hypothetical protein
MTIHLDTRSPERHPLESQAETLLLALDSGQRDPTASRDDPVPRYGSVTAQRAHREARRPGVSGHARGFAVRDDPPAGHSFDDRTDPSEFARSRRLRHRHESVDAKPPSETRRAIYGHRAGGALRLEHVGSSVRGVDSRVELTCSTLLRSAAWTRESYQYRR